MKQLYSLIVVVVSIVFQAAQQTTQRIIVDVIARAFDILFQEPHRKR